MTSVMVSEPIVPVMSLDNTVLLSAALRIKEVMALSEEGAVAGGDWANFRAKKWGHRDFWIDWANGYL
jgi:hypothetical protein